MNAQEMIKGGKAFSYLDIPMAPGSQIKTEAGSMASMASGIDLKSKINGGILRAFFLKFLGKESFFINTFTNQSQLTQQLVLTNRTPGEIVAANLQGETLFIQPGAYIASSPGINFSLRYAGFSSWMAGEGLFRLKISGKGVVWYGAFGAIVEKEVDGSYIVDSGHLLSYPSNMSLHLQLSGGLFSSFFSGEGFVLRLEGKGRIKLQTRSLDGLAGWLNPKFWG